MNELIEQNLQNWYNERPFTMEVVPELIDGLLGNYIFDQKEESMKRYPRYIVKSKYEAIKSLADVISYKIT